MHIRNVLAVLFASAVMVSMVSCGGDGDDGASIVLPANLVRSTTLTAAQENPPTTSTATGRGAIIVNPTTKAITGGMTFSGLTPTTGGHHIHQAPAGLPAQNGPVIIGLTLAPDGLAATVPPGTVLTDAQYAALLAGELYFNVHTTANPAGEIRGQITQRGTVTAGLATLTGAQEVPSVPTAATGTGTVVVDSTTGEILIAYVTHTVAAANNAHIHTGAPGVSGGVSVGLTLGTGSATAPQGATMTNQNLTDFNAGNLYFNVHSPTYPDGEIRGQIAVQ